MEVVITRRFAKDVEKELAPKLKLELASLIESIQLASSLNDIPNQKKLKGHKIAYRIKFGEYRIGFLFENDITTLSRIGERFTAFFFTRFIFYSKQADNCLS